MTVINNEYILPITYNCNWFCDYCIVDTHNQKPIPISTILLNIRKIPDNSIVHIEGGEPGMLDKKNLIIILNKLKEKSISVFLNTNGLFLKRYPELVDQYIDDVLYHCIEDVSSRKDIVLYEIANVTYMLIATDDTIHDIIYYLEKYDIIFFVSRAINYKKPLSIDNAKHLINNYNLSTDSKNYLLGLENE